MPGRWPVIWHLSEAGAQPDLAALGSRDTRSLEVSRTWSCKATLRDPCNAARRSSGTAGALVEDKGRAAPHGLTLVAGDEVDASAGHGLGESVLAQSPEDLSL